MSKCEICLKTSGTGNTVSHSNRKTKRKWNLNVQKIRLEVKGKLKRISICTRCLRTRQQVKTVTAI
ncbi:MAG: 50S ribosomal protein L28 [Dehalococcoidia bacterium]|nr:50S ribosomal protein L28 [Dehalococcoidia bacterium]